MRKYKEDKPILAICYDFDKTLSPDDMQAQGYIQAVYPGDVSAFWKESNVLAIEKEMDSNLAYMYKMVEEAEGKIIITRNALAEYGAKVELFPGVADWFERIRRFGADHGVIVEHYIISSGLKEMIEGTEMAKEGAFTKVYASSFMFNERGVAVWPAQVVNYTNKTQFLFRIEKGVLDVNDTAVNDHFAKDEKRVPFRNMIYIGDSDTDIPCMNLVNSNGGHSIAVYNPDTADKSKAYKMMRENRIKYFTAADYSEGTELDGLIKSIIEQTALNERLLALHSEKRGEMLDHDNKTSEEERNKEALIIALENSHSFARTHEVISKLSAYSKWSDEHKEALFRVAVTNKQVFYILQDNDVCAFFSSLISEGAELSEHAAKVKEEMEQIKLF